MRQGNGIGHILLCLVCGEAEHHALISCSGIQIVSKASLSGLQRLVDAHGDIRGLLIYCDQNGTGIAVEAVF